MRSTSTYSLLDIAVLRWKWISLWTAAFIVLAACVTLLLPKKYASQMEFLVTNARQQLTLTPERSAAPVMASELTEADVNSEIQLLTSHDLLLRVVRDKDLYRPYLKAGERGPTAATLELATMHLAKNLDVSAVRKTDVIEARYRAHSPQEAAEVMSDLATRYEEAHLAAHSTPGSVNFYSREMEGYRDALLSAEAKTDSFEQSSQIYSADQQRAALVNQLEDVNARLENTRADLAEANARLSALRSQLASTPARIASDEKTAANPMTVDHLQTLLAEMENRRISLLMQFHPGDREVVELEKEIANTQAELAAARHEFASENTTAINPVQQGIAESVDAAEASLDGLQARHGALEALQASYLAQLRTFDTQATKLGDLQRDQSLAQQSYTLYGERMEEAQVAHQMDKDNFTNVSMIETPVASPLPVWPVLPLNLAIGALFGMLLGLATAYVWPNTTGDLGSRRQTRSYFHNKDLASQVAGD